MSKEIIKAKDKVINRYSKTGLEEVNLENKDIKKITSKIQDAQLNTNYDDNKILTKSDSSKIRTKNKSIKSNENSNKTSISDMSYSKSNLDNTYEGEFRNISISFDKINTKDSSNNSISENKKSYNNQDGLSVSHKKHKSYSNKNTALREENISNKLNMDRENKSLFEKSNQINSLNYNSKSSTYYEDKSSYIAKDTSNIELNKTKTSKILNINKYAIYKIKLENLQKSEAYLNTLIKENEIKERNSLLKLEDKTFSSSIKHKMQKTVVNILDNKDDKDVSNEVIKSVYRLNLKRKQIVKKYKFVKTGINNIRDNHNIKKEKTNLYKRLKFDDELIGKEKKLNKTKLREKSLFASTSVNLIHNGKDKVLSKYIDNFETDDKTDTSNILLKDARRIRGSYSDIREGFSTRKTKRNLSSSKNALKEKQSKLKYDKKYKSNVDKKNVQKKFIKKTYAKNFTKGKLTLKQKVARKAGGVVKALGATFQRAIIGFFSTLITTFSVPIIAALAIFIGIGLYLSVLVGSYAQVFIYTYQANDYDITRIDQEFTKMELELEAKAYNPPPGYDEYKYRIDPIEHNMDDLPSYFSLKYHKGFTFLKVNGEIKDLFSQTYSYRTWIEEEERKRTVTKTVTDEDGNETQIEVEETYIVKIFNTEVKNNGLENIIKNNLEKEKHKDFDTFKETKGFFTIFHQPLDTDYKKIVKEKYGYQFELNSKEKIKYNDFMELRASKDDKVYAMIDGYIREKNGYVELSTIKGNIIKYYNISLTNKDKEVKRGDIIGNIQEIEQENGEKTTTLKIEILDKKGNTLDPYYYIESKIPGNPQVNNHTDFPNINISNINPTGSGKDAVELAKSFVGRNGAYMFKNFITPMTGHTTEEWCADFCASVIAKSIGGSIKGNTIYDRDGKPFLNWSASVAAWAEYAKSAGILHKADGSYKPKAGDLVLSYGNHIEIIADPDSFTTISGNSGHNDDRLSLVKVKTAGSIKGWIGFSPRWTNDNTYIISIPYKDE